MRRFLALGTLFLPVLAGLVAAGPLIAGERLPKSPLPGERTTTTRPDRIGEDEDVVVVSILQETFTDQGPAWAAAFGGADLLYDPAGSYPDLSGYDLLLADTSDLWWQYSFAADEEAWVGFHAQGGCVWVVGQDYLFSRGSCSGFPQEILGLESAVDDAAWDADSISWSGAADGPFEGLAGTVTDCFAANGLFADDVTPAGHGIAVWTDDLGVSGEAGCIGNRAGLSTLEFACGSELAAVAGAILTACRTLVPVRETSWGRVKVMYGGAGAVGVEPGPASR